MLWIFGYVLHGFIILLIRGSVLHGFDCVVDMFVCELHGLYRVVDIWSCVACFYRLVGC